MLLNQKEQNLLLRNILKSVIGQVFRSNLSYKFELHIEGTVGITIDHEKTAVFHFDDKIDASQSKDIFLSELFNRVFPSTESISCSSAENILAKSSLCMNLLSPLVLNHSSNTATESNSFDPVETDPQLEVIVESIPDNVEIPHQSTDEQESSKMMRSYNSFVSNNNKFDPMISANVISDSEDDQVSNFSFTQKFEAAKTFKKYPKPIKSMYHVTSRKMPLSDSKESVLKKISKLKKKTVIFTRRPSQSPLDTFDVESNLSNFSFDHSVDGVDSKADLFLGKRNEGQNNGKLNICEVCGMKMKSISQLEGHLVSKHEITDSVSLGKITNFSCPVCRKRYRFQAQLVKHSLRHEVRKPFNCHICRNSYRCKESLNLHMQVHDRTVNLTCDICMKSYNNRILFQKHIAYMHEKIKDGKV